MQEIQYGGTTLRPLKYDGYYAGEDGQIWTNKRGAELHPLVAKQNCKNKIWVVSLYAPGKYYERKLSSGTISTCISPRTIAIHTLIASVWLPLRPNPQHEINHKDFNRQNNKPDNLEWLTKPMNTAHFIAAHPLHQSGESNPQHKLSNSEVTAIRELKGKMTLRLIGELFGISKSQVSKVQNRKLWTHI